MFLVVLMYALFAATFPLAKLAMNLISSPLFFLSMRMLLAGAGMTFASLATTKERISPTWEDAKKIALSGFFAIFIAFGFEFWAIQFVSSIKVNIFYSLSPFMTALFAYLISREALSSKKMVGLVIGFCGMIPLSWDLSAGVGSFLPSSVYDLALLISVASAAFAWLLIKKLLQRGLPMLFINGTMTLVGGVLCAAAYLVTSQGVLPVVASWPLLLGYMGALILISNVIGYTMYGTLLHRYSPTFLSFSGFMCPLFGLLYGYLFMHEPVSAVHIISLACVFVGLSVFYWDEQAVTRI